MASSPSQEKAMARWLTNGLEGRVISRRGRNWGCVSGTWSRLGAKVCREGGFYSHKPLRRFSLGSLRDSPTESSHAQSTRRDLGFSSFRATTHFLLGLGETRIHGDPIDRNSLLGKNAIPVDLIKMRAGREIGEKFVRVNFEERVEVGGCETVDKNSILLRIFERRQDFKS